MHKVLIQQAILSPYRLGVFQALSASRKAEFTVAYGPSAAGSALVSLDDPPEVRHVRVANRFYGPGPLVTYQPDVVRTFEGGGYDTVIASLDPRIVTNGRLLARARRRGARTLLWGHGIRPSGRFAGLYRRMADAADAVILYSGEGKRKLEEIGVDPKKLFVAWNSIDTVPIARLRSETPLSARSGVLYLGRMIPEKKVPLLVRGFAQAAERLGPEARLYLVGKGADREAARALVAEMGLSERVEFVDETYEEAEVAKWMNRCWISVSPGYVGLSAIHAFAYGLPMLAAESEPHSPEVEALRPGENGLFFRSDDPEDLAAKLRVLKDDPSRLDAMGAAAIATSEGFSVEAMAAAFERAVAYAHGE